MSGIRCPKCGSIRKIEQVMAGTSWSNPPCWYCGDAGWSNPATRDDGDPFEGYPAEPRMHVNIVGQVGLLQWHLGSVDVDKASHRAEIADLLHQIADALVAEDPLLFIPKLTSMQRVAPE